MRIYLQIIDAINGNGYKYSPICIEPSDTISEVKSSIFRKYPTTYNSSDETVLFWKSKQLNDTHTLSFYNIQQRSTLTLLWKCLPFFLFFEQNDLKKYIVRFVERGWNNIQMFRASSITKLQKIPSIMNMTNEHTLMFLNGIITGNLYKEG